MTEAAEEKIPDIPEVPVTQPTEPPPRKRTTDVAGVIAIASVLIIGVVSNLDWVAKNWYKDGSLDPSLKCWEMFTSIQSVLGVQNERLADAWDDLAHGYSKVPRFADAINAQKQGLALREKLSGAKDPMVLARRARIGEYLSKQKKYSEAEAYLSQLMKDVDSMNPRNDVNRGYVLEAQARCALEQKKWSDAEKYARELTLVDDTLANQDRIGFDARELLAEVYAKSGRLPEAEVVANESVLLKDRQAKSNPVTLAIAHETLAKVLICSKRKDDAKTHFKSAMGLLEQKYGTTSEMVQYWRARYDHLLDESDPFSQ